MSFSQLNPLLGPLPAAGAHVALPLDKYPRKANLSVIISNPDDGRVLLARQLIRQPGDERQGWLPTDEWQRAGIKKIAVKITCRPLRGHFFTDNLLVAIPALAAQP